MPLMRYDAATHDWVVFAPERGSRPRELDVGAPSASPVETCPFCPGHEDSAGEEVMRVPEEDGGGWSVRIIRNKYPALDREDSSGHRGGLLFQEAGAYGAHEVVIETPEHEAIMAGMPLPQLERILGALLARSRALAEDPRLGAILVFKNHGEGAGTSIRHPHWQIAATAVVPRTYRLRHAISQDYQDWTSRCLHCDLLAGELADGSRIVAENAAFVAAAPFASRLPYQVRILPRVHAASFLLLPDPDIPALASLLQTVLRALHGALANPPFNLAVNSAALGDERKSHFHWHIDVLPRLSTPAGFELGSGMHINTVLPEAAAEALRRHRDL